MTAAQAAVEAAAGSADSALVERLSTDDKLGDDDRTALTELARQALAVFNAQQASHLYVGAEPADEPGPAHGPNPTFDDPEPT
jgi:hypothetical protein